MIEKVHQKQIAENSMINSKLFISRKIPFPLKWNPQFVNTVLFANVDFINWTCSIKQITSTVILFISRFSLSRCCFFSHFWSTVHKHKHVCVKMSYCFFSSSDHTRAFCVIAVFLFENEQNCFSTMPVCLPACLSGCANCVSVWNCSLEKTNVSVSGKMSWDMIHSAKQSMRHILNAPQPIAFQLYRTEYNSKTRNKSNSVHATNAHRE